MMDQSVLKKIFSSKGEKGRIKNKLNLTKISNKYKEKNI